MKKLLYIILGLLVIYFIVALVGPSKISVERSISVSKPIGFVRNLMGRYEFFHAKWSPWTAKDPAMTVKFSGNPGEPGHKMEWTSKVEEVGTGTLEIVGISNDSLVQKLTFEGMGASKIYYVVKENGTNTDIKWGIEMNSPFIMRPMMMMMNMDKMMGPDFESGLTTFKKVVDEMKDAVVNYAVKEMEWPETYYAGSKKETVEYQQMPDFFGKNFMKVIAELEKNKIKPGIPLGIYYAYDNQGMKADVVAAFKMDKAIPIKGCETYTIPASKVVFVEYSGDYQKMGGVYETMDAYLTTRGLVKNMSVEEYITDPMIEKDTMKWKTNVFYILK